jgi:hypothetical protein
VFPGLGFWQLFYLEMFSPLMMYFLLIWSAMLIERVIANSKQKADEERRISTSSSTNSRPSVNLKKRKPSLSAKVTHAFVFILVSMFTFLSVTAFSPMECLAQPDGTSSMVNNPVEDCFSKNWVSNIPVVILLEIVTVLVIPGYLIRALYRNRENLDGFSFLSRYGTLVEPYKDEYYWWELANMSKKTIYSVVVNLSSSYSENERVYYITLFLFVVMVVENVVRPYKFESVNVLNSLYDIHLTFNH